MRQMTTVLALFVFTGLLDGEATKTKVYAPLVSCMDDSGERFIGPKTVKTPILTSPDQRSRVYAEIEARQLANEFETCENTATLHLSVAGGPFQPVFTQAKPSPLDPTMGSLGPAAWSSDSRWLFIERGMWNYSSDCCGNGYLLYDAKSERFLEPDILGAISRRAGKQCGVAYQGFVGFSADNQVILNIGFYRDTVDGEVSCGVGSADWLFDPVTNRARPCVIRTGRKGAI